MDISSFPVRLFEYIGMKRRETKMILVTILIDSWKRKDKKRDQESLSAWKEKGGERYTYENYNLDIESQQPTNQSQNGLKATMTGALWRGWQHRHSPITRGQTVHWWHSSSCCWPIMQLLYKTNLLDSTPWMKAYIPRERERKLTKRRGHRWWLEPHKVQNHLYA